MVKFCTDHYFHSGVLHTGDGKPCQDYAISGNFGKAAFGIVSDGCSSGRNTDVGSRIISFATASAIREHWKTTPETAVQEIDLRRRVMTSGIRQLLGLEEKDMLATCLYIYLTPQGGFAHIAGDGIIAFLNKKGDVHMSCFEWNKNIPFYPAYAEDHYASFVDAHGGKPNALALTREDWKFLSEEKEYKAVNKILYSIEDGMKGIIFPVSAKDIDDIAYIAVFTDGVRQVDGIEWKSVVMELMSFKSLAGEFAKRRMIRFIQNSREIGKGPIDDIGYSVIRISDVGKL